MSSRTLPSQAANPRRKRPGRVHRAAGSPRRALASARHQSIRQFIIPALLLIFATLFAYAPALRAGYIWDDDAYVTGSTVLRSIAGLKQIWFAPGSTPQYYPLVHTTFWIEYHIWGLHPAGFHAINILLHCANALLLWLLLRRLGVRGALPAAFVFALHPVCVESVAWITERKNVLSMLFYLLSFLGWERFCLGAGTSLPASNTLVSSDRRRWLFYAASLLAFVAALLSKTVTCTLPAAALVILWWKRGRIRRSDVVALLPFFALALIFARLTVWMEHTVVGADGESWHLTALQRVLVAGRALWFYAGKLILPLHLTFVYPRWQPNPAIAWQWLFPAAALAVLIALFMLRNRIGRGPAAAVLIFAGTLTPALGFFDVFPFRYSFVADHFQYHACASLIALACASAVTIAGWLRWSEAVRISVGAAIAVVLALLTFAQSHAYADEETLWRDTLRKNRDAAMAHINLGALLENSDRKEEALSHYETAVKLEPGNAMAHYNYANMLAALGENRRADEHYAQAERLQQDALMQYHLGLARRRQERLEEAQKHFRAAIKLKPGYVDPYNELGMLLAQQKKLPEAITIFSDAIRIRSDYPSTHVNLAIALAQSGDVARSEAEFREALRYDPDDANTHMNLANNLESQGRVPEAAVELREALRLRPGWTAALQRLGRLEGR